jgi:hypothetical protein
VRHGRYVVFQLAEAAVPGSLFAEIRRRIERSDQSQRRREHRAPTMDSKPAGEVRPSSTENRSNVT